jgi:hypothetical protein
MKAVLRKTIQNYMSYNPKEVQKIYSEELLKEMINYKPKNTMTPLQYAFVKAGWIQLGGADIPVFFKYDTTNKHYPFHIIYTCDKHAYYDLYLKWYEDKLITEEYLSKVPDNFRISQENILATPETFESAVLMAISEFYYHHRDFNEANTYEYLLKEHKNKIKKIKEDGTDGKNIQS